MSAVEEDKIIKQYQPLIRALVPYEQQNRLLEGINKFSKRLPSSVRRIVKEEVLRLTSLTDAPADNSAFAQFPVLKFQHFGISMRLDKVGAQILKNETALYQNRYTVGVFESVMDSDHYQAHMKREQFKKVVDAFTVEAQSFTDIDFGDDIAITPNFTVCSSEFEKGRHCTLSALAFESMAVETRRPPNAASGEEITFTFPEIRGLTQQPIQVSYRLDAMKYNKHTGKYDSHFLLSADTDPKIKAVLKRYIEATAYQQPLQRELEIERAMQDLERDRLLENSPWLPVFIKRGPDGMEPIIALLTKANAQFNSVSDVLSVLGHRSNFAAVVKELLTYREAFVIYGTLKTKKGDTKIVATHRQLAADNQLAALIYLLNKNKSLKCLQCRLDEISSDDKIKAFSIHDMSPKTYPELESLSHVVYCRDISDTLSELTLGEKCGFNALPKRFIADSTHRPIGYVMEEELDRRCETRYLVDKAASIKLGLLSSLDATVNDLSAKGMKLTVAPGEHKIGTDIRVSIPELKIKNEHYRVVSYDPPSGIIRLCIANETRRNRGGAYVDAIVEDNSAYFKMRDIARMQRATHRYLWELSIRHLPSLSVLCVMNRHILDRMKTVYQSESSDDLYPFSKTQSVTPLHGFFADKDAVKPKSQLLELLFKGKRSTALIVHCMRKSDERLVYISEKDFEYGGMRQQIQRKLDDESIQLCTSDVTSVRCHDATTPLTKKRLAQLSKLDKTMYDKLAGMQDGYTHCIYVTNISALQNDLIRARMRVAKKKREGATSGSAS